jgi:uncharacterized membrane protein
MAGSALTLTVIGTTFLIGIIGGFGGVFGKLLVEFIIEFYKKKKK